MDFEECGIEVARSVKEECGGEVVERCCECETFEKKK